MKGITLRSDNNRYRVRVYKDNKELALGHAATAQEAVRILSKYKNGHHWAGLNPQPENNKGMIYLVVDHSTKKWYVGRKAYWYYNKFTMKNDIPSKWEYYTTSSKPVKLEYSERPQDFEFIILLECKDSYEGDYAEWYFINNSNALTSTFITGEPSSYNGMLPKLFRNGANVSRDFKALVKDVCTNTFGG